LFFRPLVKRVYCRFCFGNAPFPDSDKLVAYKDNAIDVFLRPLKLIEQFVPADKKNILDQFLILFSCQSEDFSGS